MGIIRDIQDAQRPWVLHNFGERPSCMPLIGIMEELGELAHAHLKQAQDIRTREDHEAALKDACADIFIFLCDYASSRGIDLETEICETWERVRKRDWKANPATGGKEKP